MVIVGFGACMMGGSPFEDGKSFFRRFVAEFSRSNPEPIETHLVSLAAFPAARAKNFLSSRVLSLHPDLVLLQFGALDTHVSISAFIRRLFRSEKPSPPPAPNSSGPVKSGSAPKSKVSEKKFTRGLRANKGYCALKYLACRLLRVTPTNHATFLPAMEAMLRRLRGQGIEVIVIAPFPKAQPIEDYWARRYGLDLDWLCRELGCTFVDSHTPLRRLPPSEILLDDGFHITEEAHRRVAAEILSASPARQRQGSHRAF